MVIIKSVGSLENKGVIAVCSPYPIIRFHSKLPLSPASYKGKNKGNKIW